MMDEYDVAIVGASVPGLCLANFLVKKGIKTLMIDLRNLKRIGDSVEEEILSEDALNLLKERFAIRVPKKFVESSSETLKVGSTDGAFVELNSKNYFVKKKELSAYLIGKIIDSDNFDLLERHSIKSIAYNGNSIEGIEVRSISRGVNKKIRARIIVDASGSSAVIRRMLKENRFFENEIEEYDSLKVAKETIKGMDIEEPYLLFNPSEIGRGYIFVNGRRNGRLYLEFGSNMENRDELLKEYKKLLLGEDNLEVEEGDEETISIRRPFLSLAYKNVMLLGSPGCQTNPFFSKDAFFEIRAAYHAGKAIINALSMETINTRVLWNYNLYFMKDVGKDIFMLEAIRDFFTSLGDDELKYVIEKNIIPKEFYSILERREVYGNMMLNNPSLILKPRLLKKIIRLNSYINFIKKAMDRYPNYDEFSVWKQRFNKELLKIRKSFLV